MLRFPGQTWYTSPHGIVAVWSAQPGSSCLLVIKAQHQGRRAFHVPQDERQHACETQLCQQRENVGMMEGGQERKDHEVGREARWQGGVNNWSDHAKAEGH